MFEQRRGSKFGAKKQVTGGRRYDSKKEAGHAEKLEILRLAKEIKEYVPQFPLILKVNGRKICGYKMDFKVTLPDGTIELHEVKGFSTYDWTLKWKLLEAIVNDADFRMDSNLPSPDEAEVKLILIK